MRKRRKISKCVIGAVVLAVLMAGCGKKDAKEKETSKTESDEIAYATMFEMNDRTLNVIDDNYRTSYEIFVYSFYDSDGDGIGDLNGINEKLDYLNDGDNTTDEDLGINEIWLMPICPSDTYHKYDVKDYKDIDSAYGNMDDFENLVNSCHSRGINVILDLVVNHTSSAHPWFKEAVSYIESLGVDDEINTEECPYADYYNFVKGNPGSGFEQVGNTDWYYECRFWSEMPDLNLESELVRNEIEDVISFWIEKGADGFRLDAVSYYVTGDIHKSADVLSWITSYTKSVKEDAYIVGECWSNNNEIMSMYESGVDSLFNFGFANKDGVISKTLNGNGKASDIINELSEYNQSVKAVNENYIDAPFLSNHDTGRVAGFFAGDDSIEKIKLAWGINFLQGGNAFIYYGEELGMKGSGKDENKRVGMYWNEGDFEGKCNGPADADDVKMKFPSYMKQVGDDTSIYNYVKQAIKLRNIYPEIARGENKNIEELTDDNICAFTKEYGDEKMIILINVSNEKQSINMEEVKVFDKEVSDYEIVGCLNVSDEMPVLDCNELEIPARGIVICK